MPKMLDLAQKMVRGEAPPPRVATLIGFRLTAVERGQATIEIDGKRRTLQLGQHHALEAGATAPPGAGTAGRRGVRGGRGSGVLDTCAHQIGGVAHEGSFPGADVGLLARRPFVLSGFGPVRVDRAGAVVRQRGGEISGDWRVPKPCHGFLCHAAWSRRFRSAPS